jgi:hypothetical protein
MGCFVIPVVVEDAGIPEKCPFPEENPLCREAVLFSGSLNQTL